MGGAVGGMKMSLEGFELAEIIAQSARTVVRRAVRKSDGGHVVVKMLAQEYPTRHELAQLESEHEILRKLDGLPRVVQGHGLARDRDRPVLIVEDFGGEALGRGDSSSALTLSQFFMVATAVTQALESVHARNIIHRDIKPGNIVVNWDAKDVKLIDFDAALDLSIARQSVKDMFEGSLPYMSPEQTGRMNRELDYRADYYSLGVTFFELLTGTLPFNATDTMGWVHCHISRVPPDVAQLNPSMPESLARIVHKLMDKNPDDRYQSAHGLLRDLERSERQSLDGGRDAGFALGAHDVPREFQVSHRLYGRRSEIDAIVTAFVSASRGSRELILLTGKAGMGKSAVLREVERQILLLQGRFLTGRLEESDQALPFSAFVQALRGLAKQLLVEPDDRLAEWQRRLNHAVSPSGHVLVELVPELAQVLGPQPPLPPLGPEEAHSRFRAALQAFLGAVARPESPLALVFDNLQWADQSTVELLGALVSSEIKHVLIIAGFRDPDSDGDGTTVIPSVLREPRGVIPRTVTLGPLSEESVLELVAATMRTSPETAAPLAAVVQQKTAGNPFFVHELLNLLAREGTFRLNAAEGQWVWDLGAIERAAVSNNVVELMVQRLRRLQPRTAHLLSLGACIGESFDEGTLDALADERPVAEALRDAVRDGILLHDDREVASRWPSAAEGQTPPKPRFRFQHARLYQAAYSLLDDDERQRVHLRVGRWLLAGAAELDADPKVFDVASHLNRGRALISSHVEKRRLVDLNVIAARQARQSTAYSIAASHLEVALEVLASVDGPAGPEAVHQRFEIEHDHAECVFLAGEAERANRLATQLVSAAPDAISAAAAQFLVARTFDFQGRYAEEIEVIRQAVGKLGIELPREMAEIEGRIGQCIGRMQAYLAQHSAQGLARLPRMVDPEKLMVMNLLYQLIPPAIQTCPPLFVLAELTMFELATTHGVCVSSAKNFVDCGIIQGASLGDYATAYSLAQAAFELVKQFSPAPHEAGVSFVFANFVSHWRAPYRESLEYFKRAQKIGKELGNVGHATYACALETQRLFAVGIPLDDCAKAVRAANSQLRRVRALGTLPAVATVEHAIGKLRGLLVDPQAPAFVGEDTEAQIRASGNGPFMFAHGQIEAMCAFILGDLAGAARWEAFATSLLKASAGVFAVADFYLFQGLLLCRRWDAMSGDERASAAQVLDQDLAKLANWASNCSENFGHKHLLLAAEIGRVRGANLEEVVTSFEEAIRSAGDDFPHMRALANELQGEMWLNRGHRKLARALYQEAHYLYGIWGARAKVRLIEQAHPEWFTATSGSRVVATDHGARETVVGGSLDLASAMKATRAISGEVKRERLYARLMETIVENAGAQRGCLMVVTASGTIDVVSRATDHDQSQDGAAKGPIQSTPLESSDEVCVEMVRYVARTGEALVIDDASQHVTYGNDPYIQKSRARSVLCMPILLQGKILAILYVENSAVTHAFAADRQQLLQLIASQAAVSISNARLYDSLEEKVAARTGELAARNADLERAHQALTSEMKTRQAMELELRQAQKLEAVGRLASGVAHEINTPVQFVTDSVEFLKGATHDLMAFVDKLRVVQRLVLAGEPATDAAAEATEAEEEVDFSYLVENMPPAFERSIEGLDRVATIVRSMKEFAHPDAKQMVAVDLNRAIESTLTMSRNEYKYVADVETHFGDLPMVLCHAGEVNQAILNIVVNAAHAIGDVVKATDQRGRISLRTRREGDRVIIEIEDTGGGIPEAIRNRIFDPFFTTKEVGRGTGQGLAIARSVIVDKHGGELACRSEVGIGTTFSISLPIEGKRETVSTRAA
ncbi:MAG TPA: AAA family ATPase [Polyangia bacterium]|nr:AAA family ATPase [Polyangia bacterium]